MKKVYKFGYYTGLFLLLVASFFIYSMILFITKLRLIDIIFCIIVIVVSIKYFINYTLFNYKFRSNENILFIYKSIFRKNKLLYQISLDKIDFENKTNSKFDEFLNGYRSTLTFEIVNRIVTMNVDYDMLENNKKSKRNKYYIIYIFTSILIIGMIIYTIIK